MFFILIKKKRMQDDRLMESMTVRETLKFAVDLR
jgi:ABC-type multidrug transport system ATPase subunit